MALKNRKNVVIEISNLQFMGVGVERLRESGPEKEPGFWSVVAVMIDGGVDGGVEF